MVPSNNNIHLAYGSSYLDFLLNENIPLDILEPVNVPGADDPLKEVQYCLANPLRGYHLSTFSNIKSVAIAINDKTRPVPHAVILPPLLDSLLEMGISALSIKLFIATGTHTPMRQDEFPKVLPQEVLDRVAVVSHDCDDASNLKYFGHTSRGTPVWINRQFIDSDMRIVIGNIEPHHFMGFSGAAKSLSIGLGGRETINTNHAMLIDPKASMGLYEDNPMRMDVEEIAQMAGLQYALNVVLNNKKEMVKAFAGSPRDVMQAGIAEIRKTALVNIFKPYDLVFASAGGAPKDINLYQAQKAITHAASCLRDGGGVILAAKCPEGSGSASFEAFMQGVSTMEDVFRKFNQEGFKIGPHKAFQIAKLASRVKVIMVSDIPDAQLKHWFITPAKTLEEAFVLAQQAISPINRIAVMPRATNTVPQMALK